MNQVNISFKKGRTFCTLVLFFLFCMVSLPIVAQLPLSYYLPDDASYDPTIPTPESFLGYQVGEWHVSHDQLIQYMKVLAAASNRISIAEYARTFENRPLYLLTITSPDNLANIAQIQAEHLKLSDPEKSRSVDIQNMPVVVWMGYSVHGNEPSGSNASLLVAYHLAAAQGPEMEKTLRETVILLDPSINPDGLSRFASWVNSHKSKNVSADPYTREHDEAWPRGRTNHYWFDLNRDWMPVQLPESKGRLKQFHAWKPNVLTDHHEMGTNSTFFFQPGVPSRNHPLTPARTFELTQKIATFHAAALDQIGSLYYTEEDYDDFFYGKGSTFPDINGGIGILFEQASSRGHAQESIHGELTFPFTIRNQVATSFSTLKAAGAMKDELLAHQQNFYSSALTEAAADPVKAYIFGDVADKARVFHLAEILKLHQIDMFQPKEKVTINGVSHDPGHVYVVPASQPQYRLIKAMFEKRTSFQDSLFYDISAWTFPLAFNLTFEGLNAKSFNALRTSRVEDILFPAGEVIGGESSYAYAVEWDGYYAPRALDFLLAKNLRVSVATSPFTNAHGKRFNYGSILIPVANQPLQPQEIAALMQDIAAKDGIDVYAFQTGLGSESISLGSPSFENLRKPEIMLLIGDGINSYNAGEIWHLLDQRYDMNISLVSLESFNKINLSRYNTILMPDGNYGNITGGGKEKLRQWIGTGGVVVAMQKASRWLSDNNMGSLRFKKTEPDTTHNTANYADLDNIKGAQVIGGAIFQAALDLSHPLGYGYNQAQLPVFRSNTLFLERSKNAYADPLVYTDNPLLSGYISNENLEKLKNTAAITVSAIGSGRIISLTDNPAFRGFWYGTNKLLMNSIFFGPIIKRDASRK